MSKKDDPHRFIFENELRKTWLDICSRFKVPFERQHGKRVQTLLRSEPQHRYHIW